jgi:hypothetical protein
MPAAEDTLLAGLERAGPRLHGGLHHLQAPRVHPLVALGHPRGNRCAYVVVDGPRVESVDQRVALGLRPAHLHDAVGVGRAHRLDVRRGPSSRSRRDSASTCCARARVSLRVEHEQPRPLLGARRTHEGPQPVVHRGVVGGRLEAQHLHHRRPVDEPLGHVLLALEGRDEVLARLQVAQPQIEVCHGPGGCTRCASRRNGRVRDFVASAGAVGCAIHRVKPPSTRAPRRGAAPVVMGPPRRRVPHLHRRRRPRLPRL